MPATKQVRPLAAKWYVDADHNGVPNFVERRLGYDPSGDDCWERLPCPRRYAEQGLELAERRHNTLLMLDASGSMAASAGRGQSKMAVAKGALERYVTATPAAVRLGFEVFGHKGSNEPAGKAVSCRGVQVLEPLGKVRGGSFAGTLGQFQPTGYTPLARALSEAERVFAGQSAAVNRVIVVTDGIETCGGDPIAAARALHRAGIHVTVDVVGFDIRSSSDTARLRAIAQASGGHYTDARTARDLQDYFTAAEREYQRIAASLRCLRRHTPQASACTDTFMSEVHRYMDREAKRAAARGQPQQVRAIGDIQQRAIQRLAAANSAGIQGDAAKISLLVRELADAERRLARHYRDRTAAFTLRHPCRALRVALAPNPARSRRST